MPHPLLRVLSGMLLGTAAWFSCGVLALTHDEAVVGVLPSAWAFLPLVIAGALAAVYSKIPATILLLPALTVLPWLGATASGLLLWTGPMVLILWALVLLAVVPRLALPPRSLIAASIAAVMFCVVGIVPHRSVVSGDEPHYLVIARSLQVDGDFDLANDYDVSRHGDFYGGPLEPRHTVIAPSGREYSFHGPATGVIALPGLAAGGIIGARVTAVLISALGIAALWLAIHTLTGSPGAAWAGTLFLIFQLPYAAQAAAIYPDGIAAALVAGALLALTRIEIAQRVPTWSLWAAGTALALLPWLHLRLVWVAVALGLGFVVILWRQKRTPAIFVLLSIPVISAALLFATTYVMFETFDPTAAFRQKATGSLRSSPTGILGLLFDVEYGLLPYAPAAILAAAGYRHFQSRAPVTAISAAVAAIGTLVLGGSFVWWGGTSSPARFLVPVLPCVALAVGSWWPASGRFARAICSGLVAIAGVLAVAAAYADGGLYLANEPDGRLTIFEWMNSVVRVADALPSLFRAGVSLTTEAVIAATWLMAGALGLWLPRRFLRSTTSAERVWPAAAWSIVFWITASAYFGWTIGGVQPLSTDRSQLALLHASATSRQTPWMNGWTTKSVNDIVRLLAFTSPGVGADAAALHMPSPPPGRYRVEVKHIGDPSNQLPLSLIMGRAEVPVLVWPQTVSGNSPEFTTIMPLHSVRVIADRSNQTALAVRLRPLGGRPTPQVLRSTVAEQIVRHNDVWVYLLDSVSSIESGGFWIPGDRRTRIVCALADGRTPKQQLRLEAHAERVDVTLKSGNWDRSIALAAGEVVYVEVPESADPQIIELQINGGSRRRPAVFVTAVGARELVA